MAWAPVRQRLRYTLTSHRLEALHAFKTVIAELVGALSDAAGNAA